MKKQSRVAGVVLAAGKGERMKSSKAKVLHTLAGKPMLWHVLKAVWAAGVQDVCVVIGFQGELVKRTITALAGASRKGGALEWVTQSEQLGTAHALQVTAPVFDAVSDATEAAADRTSLFRKSKRLLVICGDVPLVRPRTLRRLLEAHSRSQAACTVMTVLLDDPGHYGRILRGPCGKLEAIVETRDASETQRTTKEVNAGVYVFESPAVFEALRAVRPDNAKREFYLTDIVKILNVRGLKVAPFVAEDPKEVLGINTKAELKAARQRFSRVEQGLSCPE